MPIPFVLCGSMKYDTNKNSMTAKTFDIMTALRFLVFSI